MVSISKILEGRSIKFCLNVKSGLRGAMAFALALLAVHDLENGDGEIIFTATTAIVVLTVSYFSVEPYLLAVRSNYIVFLLAEICESLESILGQKKYQSRAN
jgi:hypothetical protein